MRIKIKKFSSRAISPSLATPGSACYDLFTAEEKIIPPLTVFRIKTDVGFKTPKGFFLVKYTHEVAGLEDLLV